MKVQTTKLIDAHQTGRAMHRLVNKFYTDMSPYAGLSYHEMYDIIKKIPFHADPPNMEVIKRPFYTMNQIGPGGDCDDKAIAMASYAKLVGIPYKFIGVGKKNPKYKKILLSHVFTQLYISGDWINADCTYPFNILGKVRETYQRVEVL